MSNYSFYPENNDNGLTLLLKKEANIILASFDKNSKEYKDKYNLYKETIQVTKAIENTEPSASEEISFIIDTLNELWKYGVLSPLTLNDDEFYHSSDENNAEQINTRCPNIYKFNEYIFNKKAFNCIVRAYYNDNTKEQLSIKKELRDDINKIYISKGGVITGEYLQTFIFKKEVINSHSFPINNVITVPVCKIQDGDNYIYVVDHREPTLTKLREIYLIPADIDLDVSNKKYNIRKYKKIK